MKYIIAYRLKRKNARRKEKIRIDVNNEEIAKESFKNYVKMSNDTDKKQYELLTGDWKHVMYSNDDANCENYKS